MRQHRDAGKEKPVPDRISPYQADLIRVFVEISKDPRARIPPSMEGMRIKTTPGAHRALPGELQMPVKGDGQGKVVAVRRRSSAVIEVVQPDRGRGDAEGQVAGSLAQPEGQRIRQCVVGIVLEAQGSDLAHRESELASAAEQGQRNKGIVQFAFRRRAAACRGEEVQIKPAPMRPPDVQAAGSKDLEGSEGGAFLPLGLIVIVAEGGDRGDRQIPRRGPAWQPEFRPASCNSSPGTPDRTCSDAGP